MNRCCRMPRLVGASSPAKGRVAGTAVGQGPNAVDEVLRGKQGTDLQTTSTTSAD